VQLEAGIGLQPALYGRSVTFLFYTGARIGEALWLDWRNIDLQRAQVQFLDTKNGSDRGVPLHPSLVGHPRQPASPRGLRFPQARPHDQTA